MRSSFAPIALAALAAANPVPQGVSSAISPESTAPAGCSSSYDGEFMIQITNVSSSSTKRSINKRQADALTMTLEDGVLTDAQGRTGYVAANQQFQFDDPPQTGAIYTAGFSACSNGTLAIGGDAIWYSCLSGTFYNLYDEATAAQCNQVYINIVGGSSGAASVMSDGQPTGSAVSSAVSVMPDGQPTGAAVSSAAVSQIADGQIQATTAATAAPVTQINDGQIQASTAAAPVTQISDGQIQASTAVAPVSQIADGQIQATTAVVSPVSQIADGQIQAPTAASGTGAVGTANGTMVYPTPSASVEAQVGSGATAVQVGSAAFGLVAAVFGIVML